MIPWDAKTEHAFVGVPPLSISVTINRTPDPGTPLLLAGFSFRHDSQLVPDLIRNITPIVHGWIALDDRHSSAWYSSEPERRKALLRTAKHYGAAWFMPIDPDERLEDDWQHRIDGFLKADDLPIWTCQVYEMFTETEFRVDGIWGGKMREKLFPITSDMHVPDVDLHSLPFMYDMARPRRQTALAFYHLREISPVRRQLRRDQYAYLDPDRTMQPIGYDYLAMEEGAVLQKISPNRPFSPPHQDDGSLWAPELPHGAVCVKDPLHSRMALIRQFRAYKAVESVAAIADATVADYPQDKEVRLWSGLLWLEAGRPEVATERLLHDSLKQTVAAQVLLSRSALACGNHALAQQAADAALACVPGSPIALKAASDARKTRASHTQPNALWRRWVNQGTASIAEGSAAPENPRICIIVFDLANTQEGLEVIQSLLLQDCAVEIVVVHSGGGTLHATLAPVLHAIRLIELSAQHPPGAARNIGIDASTAPIITFLSGDCLALSGTVQQRVQLHAASAMVVPSTLLPVRSDTAIGWIFSAFHNPQHEPMGERSTIDYGPSYTRPLFDLFGYFPTGLTGNEETALNTLLSNRYPANTTSPVVTLHRGPETANALRCAIARKAEQQILWLPVWRKAIQDGTAAYQLANERIRCLDKSRTILTAHFPDSMTEPAMNRLLGVCVSAHLLGLKRGLEKLRFAQDLSNQSAAIYEEDPEQALSLARSALSIDSCHALHALTIASLENKLGHTQEVIRMARHGLTLDPTSTALLSMLCEYIGREISPRAALNEAEHQCMLSPQTTAHWDVAIQWATLIQDSTREQFLRQFRSFLTQ